jgi:GNAT superfamily N-acetyltransferase
MKIAPYQPAHLPALMEAFQSNVPEYFMPREAGIYKKVMQDPPEEYYVIVEGEELLGGGGYLTENPGEARIVWFFVHRQQHGMGHGRALLEFLMDRIRQSGEYSHISLMTTQLTDQFYARSGFITTREENDYWKEGWDLRFMKRKV